MSLNSTSTDILLDTAFAYPEHTSIHCPFRSRLRVRDLLAADSDQLYQEDGLVAWMTRLDVVAGFHFLAETESTLRDAAKRFVPRFERVARENGVQRLHVFVASETGRETLLAAGYILEHETLRMRNDALTSPMNDARLRPMQAEDEAAIIGIMKATFPDDQHDTASLRACIHSNTQTWVAVVDGAVAGYIMLDEQEHTLLINGLGVGPDYQGHGLGKALVLKVLEQAPVRGKNAVEVLADAKPGVIAFYARCGFTAVHPAYLLVKVLHQAL